MAPTAPRFVELGESALRSGERAVARQCFDAALRQAPDSAAALYGLGAIAAEEGDQRAAVDLFERATTADPDMTKAWIGLRGAELRRAEEILAASEPDFDSRARVVASQPAADPEPSALTISDPVPADGPPRSRERADLSAYSTISATIPRCCAH